ncbi:MAG TPA: heme ABC exporter ATP-binding protein CcmA [Candidatus Binataceae bacterium]|nr:heme ABC exporter ATP-binding protein CcmA [Candidatus Binataceae bacterium]
MDQPALAARGVSMTFGLVPVLRDIDFELWPGTLAAISGANGSGKSTLVKIFAGLLRPSSGTVAIFGGHAERSRIGLLSHQSWLYPNLTAGENLEFYAALYGLRDARGRAAQWLKRVGLEALGSYRVRTISRGNEQRLAVARALIADPGLIIMDEPLTALDSAGVRLVKDLIGETLARNCAVLITAHSAEALAGLDFQLYEISRGRLARSDHERLAGHG